MWTNRHGYVPQKFCLQIEPKLSQSLPTPALDQSCPGGLPAMREMFSICTVHLEGGYCDWQYCVSKDITLLTKVHLVKAMVFPVVTYGCESWTIKRVEHWRINAFKLWCWRRLLRVTWTARRSNQSILKEINPEYSLEGLLLKLKLKLP